MNFNDRWLLVTGASSGLGQAMARQLAERHGANLIVVARRAERLEALKRELEESTAVEVYCLEADLSKAEDVERVYREATDGRHVYGVVNQKRGGGRVAALPEQGTGTPVRRYRAAGGRRPGLR